MAGSQYEALRTKKDDELTEDYLNKRWRHIDLRLTELEAQASLIKDAQSEVVERGLLYITTELRALVESIKTTAEQAANDVGELETAVNEAIERLNEDLIIDGGTA